MNSLGILRGIVRNTAERFSGIYAGRFWKSAGAYSGNGLGNTLVNTPGIFWANIGHSPGYTLAIIQEPIQILYVKNYQENPGIF